MILVTGTKRSGTSMWMQILAGAGLPWIGERFMGRWEDSIKDANPRGFYESKLRQGVFFATNPDPKTGAFLQPKQTRTHVVKVFIPGLIRTDLAYIDRVIATMRPWREYVTSIRRLYTLEDAFHESLPEAERDKAKKSVARSRLRIPPEVEWWFDHYEMIRDIATRRYPIHLTTYHRMLRDPEPEIRQVLTWLGRGEVEPALAAIDHSLNTQRATPEHEPEHRLDPEIIAVMDELYDRADNQQGMTPELITALNEHQQKMVERWGAPSRDRAREDEPAGGPSDGDDAPDA